MIVLTLNLYYLYPNTDRSRHKTNSANNCLRQRRREKRNEQHWLSEVEETLMINSNSNNLAVNDTIDESIDTNTHHVINYTSESRSSAPNSLKSILYTPATVGRYVIIRSHATLSHTELTVLDDGLTYVPTEKRPKKQRYLQEFNNVALKLRLKLHSNRGRTTYNKTRDRNHRDTNEYPDTTDHTIAQKNPTHTARHRSRDDPIGTNPRQTTPPSKNTSKEHASR